MYLSFYRLHGAPFSATPDPAFLYWTPDHREAYAALACGVEGRKGFILLSGEVGCGKTTVLRKFMQETDATETKCVYVLNPEQEFSGILRCILGELDIAYPDSGADEAVQSLHAYLLERHAEGGRVVLLVDEAQRMRPETVERLRLLSNLETDKAKLLQIVLCGQPELDALLARDDLRQIRERIAMRAHIGTLTASQARAFVKHRVESAGGQLEHLFSPGALRRVIRYGKGNPRLLNVLCDNALITGFATRQRPVSAKAVTEAAVSLGWVKAPSRKRAVALAGCVCLAIALAVGGGILASRSGLPAKTAAAKTEEPILESEASVTEEPEREDGNAAETAPETVAPLARAAAQVVATPEPSVALPRPEPVMDVPEPTEPAPTPDAPVGTLDEATAMAPTAEAEPPEMNASPEEEKATVWVTVLSGDNIGKLVERVNGRGYLGLVDEVYDLNPGLDENTIIYPGQRIAIPLSEERRTAPSGAAEVGSAEQQELEHGQDL